MTTDPVPPLVFLPPTIDAPEPVGLNPACTPGWAVDEPTGGVVAHCGCGWSLGDFPSRRKALAAQRQHRFPPRT